MTRRIYHVTPAGEAWCVRRANRRRPAGIFKRKSEAIACAKRLAKGKEHGCGQVKVHRQDGLIQTEYTYTEDPRRTKG